MTLPRPIHYPGRELRTEPHESEPPIGSSYDASSNNPLLWETAEAEAFQRLQQNHPRRSGGGGNSNSNSNNNSNNNSKHNTGTGTGTNSFWRTSKPSPSQQQHPSPQGLTAGGSRSSTTPTTTSTMMAYDRPYGTLASDTTSSPTLQFPMWQCPQQDQPAPQPATPYFSSVNLGRSGDMGEGGGGGFLDAALRFHENNTTSPGHQQVADGHDDNYVERNPRQPSISRHGRASGSGGGSSNRNH